jgi:hypothetical protein
MSEPSKARVTKPFTLLLGAEVRPPVAFKVGVQVVVIDGDESGFKVVMGGEVYNIPLDAFNRNFDFIEESL